MANIEYQGVVGGDYLVIADGLVYPFKGLTPVEPWILETIHSFTAVDYECLLAELATLEQLEVPRGTP